MNFVRKMSQTVLFLHRYSHGEAVKVSDLRPFEDPDFRYDTLSLSFHHHFQEVTIDLVVVVVFCLKPLHFAIGKS